MHLKRFLPNLHGLLTLLLYFVIDTALVIVCSLIFGPDLTFTHFVFITLFTLILIYLFNRKELNYQFIKGINQKGWMKQAFIGMGWIYLLSYLLAILVVTFNITIVQSSNDTALLELFKNTPKIMIFIGTVVLAPTLEEIVFRFGLFTLLTKNKRTNHYWPYILSALVFTFIHDTSIITHFSPTTIVTFLGYFNLSLVISFMYRKSDHNIMVVILLHSINNFISLLLM